MTADNPRSEAGRPAPRLVLRFAIVVVVALTAAGIAIAAYARSAATTRAELNVHSRARFVAAAILREKLRASDLTRPVTGARLVELDRLFERQVLMDGFLRVKLYTAGGMVTYSTNHLQLGTSPEPAEIQEVLDGAIHRSTAMLDAEGGGGPSIKVLETYVPVSLGEGSAPVGAFEVYQDYEPVAAEARHAYLPVAGVLLATLLTLVLAMIPVLRRVTRQLRQQVEAMTHQALHDPLTGLPNRALFVDRLEQAIASAKRRSEPVAVLLLDLDRFKEVNDTLGHQSGDRFVAALAERLEEARRGIDTVARTGGDEFGVVAPATGSAGALVLAEKLRKALGAPLQIAGIDLEATAGIGIARYPEDGGDAETLIRRADVALERSKAAHEPVFYTSGFDHYSEARLRLAPQLRRAPDNGELVLLVQPQLALASGRIESSEALVRWNHPDLGLLEPSMFIPLAESTGLIRSITRWMLRAGLEQAAAWHEAGVAFSISVNMSARDLQDAGFTREVVALLDRTGVPAEKLTLELTENTILSDPVYARAVLAELASLGVKLAVDDYGTGHSSLGYLKRLPVDELKIDKSFVRSMGSDSSDEAIVRSTIELGHNLGLSVVAEGVEDEETLLRLAALGCDRAQGFHIGRPDRPETLVALAEDFRRRGPIAA
jgi:diguanylate cyclase